MTSLARLDIEQFMVDHTGWASPIEKSPRTQPEWNGTRPVVPNFRNVRTSRGIPKFRNFIPESFCSVRFLNPNLWNFWSVLIPRYEEKNKEYEVPLQLASLAAVLWGGALRDETHNGCERDYITARASFVHLLLYHTHFEITQFFVNITST